MCCVWAGGRGRCSAQRGDVRVDDRDAGGGGNGVLARPRVLALPAHRVQPKTVHALPLRRERHRLLRRHLLRWARRALEPKGETAGGRFDPDPLSRVRAKSRFEGKTFNHPREAWGLTVLGRARRQVPKDTDPPQQNMPPPLTQSVHIDRICLLPSPDWFVGRGAGIYGGLPMTIQHTLKSAAKATKANDPEAARSD
eukprot:2283400-Pyramimonas_sp.AAC.2